MQPFKLASLIDPGACSPSEFVSLTSGELLPATHSYRLGSHITISGLYGSTLLVGIASGYA